MSLRRARTWGGGAGARGRRACVVASVLLGIVVSVSVARAQVAPAGARGAVSETAPATAAMDTDLFEASIPQLQRFYASRKYTVTQVLAWHLDRLQKYDGIYRSVEFIDRAGALESATRMDAQAAAGPIDFAREPMWGVPIVIKANTSIRGLVTTDGWQGYTLPGKELVAPRDATIVAKLRKAGALIIGHSNMPDFAASDTNRSTSFGRTGNAYDVRFSPGGSSGGTVTAVTANFAVLGNGTDTGNSIRMPAATSAVVGVFPTRGLVSTAGIAPLDWLLDNTGPIARTVTDAAIALGVMAGEDPLDPSTLGSASKAQPAPFTRYLSADALKGKRFGVPAFVLQGAGVPFQGVSAALPTDVIARRRAEEAVPLTPETRAAFIQALEGLRAAGATVVFDEAILPDRFADEASRIFTVPYVREGTETFLKTFGPSLYRSVDAYAAAIGSPLPSTITGAAVVDGNSRSEAVRQRVLGADPEAEANYHGPRRRVLEAYLEVLDRLHLDGLVYPATQMPPPDETMPQDGKLSGGPHSATSWVNMLGVPAVVVPGGFYAGGLPFGPELSARPWRDGDLLGWAYAYEQATHHRRPPVLVEKGLLPNAGRPFGR